MYIYIYNFLLVQLEKSKYFQINGSVNESKCGISRFYLETSFERRGPFQDTFKAFVLTGVFVYTNVYMNKNIKYRLVKKKKDEQINLN